MDAIVTPMDDKGFIQDEFEFNVNRGEILDILKEMTENDFYDWIKNDDEEDW